MLPEEPTPTNSAPVLGSIANGRLACPRTMPNTPLLVSIACPLMWGDGLRLIGRNVGGLLVFAVPRAHVAQRVRYLPDPVLVGHQDLAVAPGQPVGLVEALRVPLDELGLTVGVAAQKRQITGLLLSDNDVAVRQHEQPARMLQFGKSG